MSTQYPSPARLNATAEVILTLLEAADLSARKVAGKLRRSPPKRGLTLPPGPDTPLVE